MKDKVKYILQIPISKANQNFQEHCDIVGLKFDEENISENIEKLKKILPFISKPIMIRGCGNDNLDKQLLPEIIDILDRECIIGIINENNYKSIIPSIIKGKHKAIIRTPIDINLAKEMNILTADMGLLLDKIIIDTDIGGLGYGFEYGYSIMEKIKLEGKAGDKYLNMPLISFATEETAKTKEAKNPDLAFYFEIASASAVKAAGADYIVLTNPNTYNILKELEK